MLGLFDSGSGGLNTVRYIRNHLTQIDLVYKIDRNNSPYGIKTEEELIKITENNIDELVERGAKKVLIACCTASTVYEHLDNKHKRLSIPIISPIATYAKQSSQTGHIGVIATERTVRSHAFRNALPKCCVTEIAAQDLVSLIDSGLNDSNATKNDKFHLLRIVREFANKNIDTLILGCTHFPALKTTFENVCRPIGIKNIIDSAETGAKILYQSYLETIKNETP